MFLMELLFANCMNVIPEAAASRGKSGEGIPIKRKQDIRHKNYHDYRLQSHSPTMPNKMQYMAANIGNGIEAKNAPNFPERCKVTQSNMNTTNIGKNFQSN